MTIGTSQSRPVREPRHASAAATSVRLALAATLALTLAGCKTLEEGTRVAGWELTDPLQRHPILVSQTPETLNIAVPRGANGLSPSQRSDVLGFSHQARASDAGNSRLVIAAPSGSSNETAAIDSRSRDRRTAERERLHGSRHQHRALRCGWRVKPAREAVFPALRRGRPRVRQLPNQPGARSPQPACAELGCASQKNLAATVRQSR